MFCSKFFCRHCGASKFLSYSRVRNRDPHSLQPIFLKNVHQDILISTPLHVSIFDQKWETNLNKMQSSQSWYKSRYNMRTRTSSVICSFHQLPCCSPRDERINFESPRLCRQRMVCLHFTPSLYIATPPPRIVFSTPPTSSFCSWLNITLITKQKFHINSMRLLKKTWFHWIWN